MVRNVSLNTDDDLADFKIFKYMLLSLVDDDDDADDDDDVGVVVSLLLVWL